MINFCAECGQVLTRFEDFRNEGRPEEKQLCFECEPEEEDAEQVKSRAD